VRLERVDLPGAADPLREPGRVQAPVRARVDDRVTWRDERVERRERVLVAAALDRPREAGRDAGRGDAQAALERVGAALQNPACAQGRLARRPWTWLW
jgi:hypothetical protein